MVVQTKTTGNAEPSGPVDVDVSFLIHSDRPAQRVIFILNL